MNGFARVTQLMDKFFGGIKNNQSTILPGPGLYNNDYEELARTPNIWGTGINLNSQAKEYYGKHRSGWSYAISSLHAIHNDKATYLESFIERTFGWELATSNPHRYDWIGFVHVPPNIPSFLPENVQSQHFDNLRKSDNWKISEEYCKGLFTLSSYLADYVRKATNVPVSSLFFPTEIPDMQWSIERFQRNRDKKIVQIGWWLRSLCAIFELPKSNYSKVYLKLASESWLEDAFEAEKKQRKQMGKLQDWMFDTASTLPFLQNDEYDLLLSENIAFVNLYDTSANNVVIECIARGTPLLINRLPAVVEYLGEEYPLYYETYEEAIQKAKNYQLLYETSLYLSKPERRRRLTRRHFLESFLASDVYRAIN